MLTAEQMRILVESHIFLTAKYDGRGQFENIKGRLVGDDSTQDRAPYEHLDFPTTIIESVFMTLQLSSRKKMWSSKAVFTEAYFNEKIAKGDTIMMRLTAEIMAMLVEEFPEVEEFIEEQGRLIVRILKALFGLVQYDALWSALLYGFLIGL